MSVQSLAARVAEYHKALPGIIRAALVDHGISPAVIDCQQLGWDGTAITVPIRDRCGRAVLLERWEDGRIGVPADGAPTVELYGWHALLKEPEQVLIAEGIHEALILESNGLVAVAASGTGRFFKEREWGHALANIPDVVLAYRRGERPERKLHLPSRREVVMKARGCLPNAREFTWPEEVGDDGGAFAFFVTLGRSARELSELLVS